MEKIGFIGLGIMGKPMSRNLLKAGYELEVFDISKDAVAEIVKAGAHACASPKEIAEKCSLIITMVPNSPEVKEALLGEDGAAKAMTAGKIVLDCHNIIRRPGIYRI